MADVITRLKLESGEYDSKIKRAVTALQQMETGCRKVGGSLAVLEKDQKEYVRNIGRMETVSTSVRGKIGELTNAYTELAAQYRRLTDEEKKGDFGKALNASLTQLKQRISDSKKELNDIARELGDTSAKSLDLSGVMQTLGSKIGINSEALTMLSGGTIAYTAVLGGLTTAVIAGTKAWSDYNEELSRQSQITTVTTGLKGVDADRMADAAKAIADVYNTDFREVINAANTLMTQFGKSGDDAIRLISEGMQGMIQGDGSKLLSMIQQYAPSFRDAGIEASQLVAIIQNSEGGIFTDQNMNAIVMGIKNIRLMTKATSDALAKLGIDGKKMSEDLSNGAITIFDALRQVSTAVQGVGSGSQAAGEVMQQVFGRQGAMAGTKLGEAIATLNTNLNETKNQTGEVGKAYDDLRKASERLNNAVRETFGYDGYEIMATGIRTKLYTALSDVLDVTLKIKSSWVGDVGKTIFDTMTDAALRLSGPLGSILTTLKQIAGLGGNDSGSGGGISASDQAVNRAVSYINSAPTSKERNRRYRQQISNIDNQISSLGEEKSRVNADGSTSYYVLSPDQQQSYRAALEQQKQSIIRQVVSDIMHSSSTTPTKTNPIKPIVPLPKTTKEDIKYADDSIMAQEKLISDLTQKWKTAAGAVRDDYAIQLDAAKAKLKEMTAVDNTPAFTMAELESTSPQSIDLRGNRGRAQDKLNLATAAFATGGTSDIDFSNYISGIKNALSNANIGDELYNSMTEKLKDATTMSTLLQELMERGMTGADLENTAQALKDKLLSPDGINQEAVQAWLDELNKQIEEAGGVGLKLNSETGEVSDDKKKSDADLTTAINKATIGVNALSSINSGLKGMGIDLGDDIGNAISIVQSMMTIVQGVQAIVSLFQTPAIVANTAALSALNTTLLVKSFLPGFANGGIVPHAAEGFVVPGNHFSGDVTPILANAGEVVLNRSQVGNLAAQLEGGGFDNLQLDARVSAEDIIFILNNNANRRGYRPFIND